eukprot:1161536-Pelagomonas_calceolata.AAC.3
MNCTACLTQTHFSYTHIPALFCALPIRLWTGNQPWPHSNELHCLLDSNPLLIRRPLFCPFFVCFLLDFGLAINLGPTATHVSNITTGTPFYCAPEVSTMSRTACFQDLVSFSEAAFEHEGFRSELPQLSAAMFKIAPGRAVPSKTGHGGTYSCAPWVTHMRTCTNAHKCTQYCTWMKVPLNGRATKASDVFSFGVVMAEICSKTPPWIKVKGEFLVNPRFPNFGPDMPRAFGSLAMRCASP